MVKDVLISFLGVVVGGLFSLCGSYLSMRASYNAIKLNFTQQQEEDYIKNKRGYLEALYLTANKRMEFLNTIYAETEYFLNGTITKESYKKAIGNSDKKRKYDSNKMEMIIAFYFQDLEPEYQKYNDVVYKFSSYLNELLTTAFKSEELLNQSKGKILEELEELNEQVNDQSDEFLKAIRLEFDRMCYKKS